MKPRTIILMLVAVGGGLIASFATSKFMGAKPAPQQQEEEVDVLVAKQNIQGYVPLRDANAFLVKRERKSSVSKDAVSDFERVKGRSLKYTLAKDKPLAESDLLPSGEGSITDKLKHGERAMSVKITPERAVSGFILPGNKVDVVATQTKGNNQEPVTATILQDIEVLAIDGQITAPDGTINKQADRITLRVTPEQAQALTNAIETGTIQFVARRPDDPTQVDLKLFHPKDRKGTVPGKTESSEPVPPVIGHSPIRAPEVPAEPGKPEAKGPHKMTIIIGNKTTEHVFHSDGRQEKPEKVENP